MKKTRWACLILLLACVALWALSYSYIPIVIINTGKSQLILGVEAGLMCEIYLPPMIPPVVSPPSCHMQCRPARPGRSLSFHLLDGDLLGFTLSLRASFIPLWFPTLVLGAASLYVWLKKPKQSRGFPVETHNSLPLA